jgi:hypothetical protein
MSRDHGDTLNGNANGVDRRPGNAALDNVSL